MKEGRRKRVSAEVEDALESDDELAQKDFGGPSVEDVIDESLQHDIEMDQHREDWEVLSTLSVASSFRHRPGLSKPGGRLAKSLPGIREDSEERQSVLSSD